MSKYLKIKNDDLLSKIKEFGKIINKPEDEMIENAIAFYLQYQVYLIQEIKPAHEKLKEIAVDQSLSLVEKLVQLDSLYYEKTGIYFPNLHNHIVNQKELLVKGNQDASNTIKP